MRFGLVIYPTDHTIDPVTLGRAAEERRFESLFFPEHTHIPVHSRHPGTDAPDRLAGYARAYDPFIALAAVAATTTNIHIGTGVCLVAQRDPITTAKEVATIDHLCGGRFLFGVGAGWNAAETANHGTEPGQRMAVLAERVHAMRAIWTHDEASYHGQHVNFEPLWSWPKPLTKPHPPILVGGNGTTVEDRVLDFGDEWLPQRVTLVNVSEFGRRAAALQRRAAERGRGPIPITLYAAAPDPATIEAYADVGITRCLFALPDAGPDTVLPLLDRLAKVISETSVAGS
jgi:probable F420-dependent oxidoreductase